MDVLNNREWAILLWVSVFVAWASTQRDARSSFYGVVRAFAEPKILLPLGVMIGWIALEIWLGSQLGIWRTNLAKDAIIWFVATGLILYFNSADASTDPHFFRRNARAVVLPAALLTALIDDFVFPVIVEIALVLSVAVVTVFVAVAKADPRHRSVEKLGNVLLALFGISLVAFAAFKLVAGWEGLDRIQLLLEALLPVWLTLGLLPFIYVIGLLAAYEVVFMRLRLNSPEGWRARACQTSRPPNHLSRQRL